MPTQGERIGFALVRLLLMTSISMAAEMAGQRALQGGPAPKSSGRARAR
jgi:hypothetical protein